MKKQTVLIVDDSAFVRRMLQDWIGAEPDLEIVGVAHNGEQGIAMAKELKPDVVTLDVEMPVMNGLQALPQILAAGAKVLMVSSVTTSGAKATLDSLDAGAYDFVTKPNNGASIQFVQVKQEILDKIRAARYARDNRIAKIVSPVKQLRLTTDKIVVIASSTGGPKTLRDLFEALPKSFPAPILVVQHMPATFTASLAARLNDLGTVPCQEAKDGDYVEKGKAYIAPGGYHMVVGNDNILRLNHEPPIHGVRPAADNLFFSAAKAYGSKTLGVVLTGMGRDGADGAVAIRNAGGIVFGEAESTCVIYGMPKAAKQAGGIDEEFALQDMAAAIAGALASGVKRAG